MIAEQRKIINMRECQKFELGTAGIPPRRHPYLAETNGK
jgi:hypothetical protein